MKTYNTSQRQHLVDFMKNNADRQYTIEEIAEHIENVGKSTVYRLINRMVDGGTADSFSTNIPRLRAVPRIFI